MDCPYVSCAIVGPPPRTLGRRKWEEGLCFCAGQGPRVSHHPRMARSSGNDSTKWCHERHPMAPFSTETRRIWRNSSQAGPCGRGSPPTAHMRTSTKKLPSPGRGRLNLMCQSFSIQHVLAEIQTLQDDLSQFHQAGALRSSLRSEDAARTTGLMTSQLTV